MSSNRLKKSEGFVALIASLAALQKAKAWTGIQL
jgi:hypothetical protein